jgi:hypothetical protein
MAKAEGFKRWVIQINPPVELVARLGKSNGP